MKLTEAVKIVKNHIGAFPKNPRLEEALDTLTTAHLDMKEMEAKLQAARNTITELIEQNKMLSKPF